MSSSFTFSLSELNHSARDTFFRGKVRIIDSRVSQGFFKNEVWDVYYVDWREAASPLRAIPPGNPWNAYANAAPLGKKLADRLASLNYGYIHFIAHSAGSNLVETAAVELAIQALKTNIQRPVVHSTFLDAYTPNLSNETYGFSATFAEQYVDVRREFGVVNFTNTILPGTFNFDVSTLDPDQTDHSLLFCSLPGNKISCLSDAINHHSWPYLWYRSTVDQPNDWQYGLHIAKEYSTGALPSQDDFPKAAQCFLTSASTICPTAKTNLRPEIQPIPLTVTNPFSFANNTANSTPVTFNKSDTGSVVTALLPATGIHLTLTTGSPVWVRLGSNMTEGFNTLQFDYSFAAPADGLLSVFFDDQVVFKADQRDAKASANPSGRISVGNVVPGQHTLSFRLDHFTSAQSSVEISNIVPSNVSIIQVVNLKPVANAGAKQKVRLGTLVKLDGARSFDPDRKPLPLTYDWKQTSGPTVLLFDSTTATPKFTPITKGHYEFSLVVNDGQSNSNISTVKVHASKNGDLDEEENDTGTSCLMCNPFSK